MRTHTRSDVDVGGGLDKGENRRLRQDTYRKVARRAVVTREYQIAEASVKRLRHLQGHAVPTV
jgi:hypothetical protein